MKATLLAVGSRGDVQPYLTLGRRLTARGHTVRVAAPSGYRTLVEAAGLTCVPLSFDPVSADPLAPPSSDRPAAGRWRDDFADSLTEAAGACAGADVIVYSQAGVAGQSLAERDGVLGCEVLMHPRVPAVPGSLVQSLRYRAFLRLLWLAVRRPVNRWRKDALKLDPLGLSPWRRPLQGPTLLAYSPALVPPARRTRSSETVTGAWLPDRSAEWTPPAGLARFLAAGPPPVYVALDRLTQRADPAHALRVVPRALRSAGVRAVVSGNPDLIPAEPDLHPVADVPHDWLFRRVSAVVHHGGAGTTAAALAAGAPSVVLPVWADQPFWAHRVAALGAGLALPPLRRVGPDRLAAAVGTAVCDPRPRARALEIGERIAAEDGTGAACDLIEEWSCTSS